MDTRPAASAWRGSAVRPEPARSLARGTIDMASMSPSAPKPERRWLQAAAAIAAVLALSAVLLVAGTLSILFFGQPATS